MISNIRYLNCCTDNIQENSKTPKRFNTWFTGKGIIMVWLQHVRGCLQRFVSEVRKVEGHMYQLFLDLKIWVDILLDDDIICRNTAQVSFKHFVTMMRNISYVTLGRYLYGQCKEKCISQNVYITHILSQWSGHSYLNMTSLILYNLTCL